MILIQDDVNEYLLINKNNIEIYKKNDGKFEFIKEIKDVDDLSEFSLDTKKALRFLL